MRVRVCGSPSRARNTVSSASEDDLTTAIAGMPVCTCICLCLFACAFVWVSLSRVRYCK